MKKAIDIFGEWAKVGKDQGMELTHADSVQDMLNFVIEERKLLGKKFRFLDLGCGNGWVVRKMKSEKSCIEVVGLDGADQMIKNAREKDTKSVYILADINSFIPYKKFDIIHSMEVLYYLDHPQKVIKNILDFWLEENGRLIIGIDHYYENFQSHSWQSKVGTKMLMLKESEWVDFFKVAGFKDIKKWRSHERSDWGGTLIITGKK